MEGRVEDEYFDILQNIEAAVAGEFRANPELTDSQVDAAYEALGRTYQRESQGGEPVLPRGEQARKVYDAVKQVCDWRLGHQPIVDADGQPLPIEPITVTEIQACLKRLRRSLKKWNKDYGTRGYLTYISNFL